jgi:hypothetical protein
MSTRRRSLAVVATITLIAAAAVMASVATGSAVAWSSYRSDCGSCHVPVAAGVTATPSTVTPAAGATYSVAVAIDLTAAGRTGFWVADSTADGSVGSGGGTTGGPGTQTRWTAVMTAPIAPGVYYYKVFGAKGYRGQTAAALYSITVSATPPPPTPDPDPAPAPTPDPAPAPTPDPVAPSARIVRVTPSKAVAGKRITVIGEGFGTVGTVRFGSRKARVASWKTRRIVCIVPKVASRTRTVRLVIIPRGGEQSNPIDFKVTVDRRRIAAGLAR